MGGAVGSTMRWTPLGPVPTSDRRKLTATGRPCSDGYLMTNHAAEAAAALDEMKKTNRRTENASSHPQNHEGEDDETVFMGSDHLASSGVLMGVDAPPLYDACLVGRWDDALEVCRTHPHEARYADRRRNTALHVACRRQPPPEVVRTLLRCGPGDAVTRGTNAGMTAMHFAAYCGAGPVVVGMLLDRMAGDAAVARAKRWTESGLNVESLEGSEGLWEEREEEESGNGGGGQALRRHRRPATQKAKTAVQTLPPSRLLDRRKRTPLHCACAGFRTRSRPAVVRKLLSADPASANLEDERGRTPLSLLFDDYAEEVVEALEDDVTPEMVRRRTDEEGGELYECWEILCLLLQAAYQGSVDDEEELKEKQVRSEQERRRRQKMKQIVQVHPEDEEKKDGCGAATDHQAPLSPGSVSTITAMVSVSDGTDIDSHIQVHSQAPQANPAVEASSPATGTPPKSTTHQHKPHAESVREVNVLDYYDKKTFSIVHAAAGVWECPPPLARLVLKRVCGTKYRPPAAIAVAVGADEEGQDQLDKKEDGGDKEDADADSSVAPSSVAPVVIRQQDEETMRLPLHIAACARPEGGARDSVRHWLSHGGRNGGGRDVHGSIAPTLSAMQASGYRRDGRGGSTSRQGGKRGGGSEEVYNPRFGRSSVSSESSMSSAPGGLGGLDHRQRTNSEDEPSSSSNDNDSVNNNNHMSSMTGGEAFRQHTIVRDVLELHPEAASIPDHRTGKLPVVLAVESGKSWETAVGPLLEAYPDPFGKKHMDDGGDADLDSDEASGMDKLELEEDEHGGTTGGLYDRHHREAMGKALGEALMGPGADVRAEAARTAGMLAQWGGVWGYTDALDGWVQEWIRATVAGNQQQQVPKRQARGGPPPPSSSDAAADEAVQVSLLTAVAEAVSHSRKGAMSDRVAKTCLDAGKELLRSSRDAHVREAAARVLGAALDAVGDADDAATVMREVVLHGRYVGDAYVTSAGGAGASDTSGVEERGGGLFSGGEDVVAKHGRLLACHSILRTRWGSDLMKTSDISDAVVALLRERFKDRNVAVRSAAFRAVGPVLGRSADSKATLKEIRSDLLKGTRAGEQADVQIALARGLRAALRMCPDLFLCKAGAPLLDAALMLAVSSTVRPNVQKSFQAFLWVALQVGMGGGDDCDSVSSVSATGTISSGVDQYIKLAEGENGRIMMKFVTRILAKIEDVDDPL